MSIETNEKRRLTSPPPNSSAATTIPLFLRTAGLLLLLGSKANALQRRHFCATSFKQSPATEANRSCSYPTELSFFGLTWTLDGREIIACSGTSTFTSGSLWRIAADGSGSQSVSLSRATGPPARVCPAKAGGLPTLAAPSDYNIWRLELTGTRTGSKSASQDSSLRHAMRIAPSFLQMGRKIAFYSNRSGNDEIWVCNRDGNAAVQITSLGGPSCGTPRWSPDGEQIAFDSSPDGHWDIFVVGANGGKPRRLTNQPSFESVPCWSRDGKWIYFCSDRGGTYQIWKMPPQGGEAMQVTSKGGICRLRIARRQISLLHQERRRERRPLENAHGGRRGNAGD